MFLADFQLAGGKIKQMNRIVDSAKYNIYECLINFEGLECKAMIQEHESGMVLLGFQEQETERRIKERMDNRVDEEQKKLIKKRDRWMSAASVLRMLSIGLMFYYSMEVVTALMIGAGAVVLLRSVMGILLGFSIKQIAKGIQGLYANVIPVKLNVY